MCEARASEVAYPHDVVAQWPTLFDAAIEYTQTGVPLCTVCFDELRGASGSNGEQHEVCVVCQAGACKRANIQDVANVWFQGDTDNAPHLEQFSQEGAPLCGAHHARLEDDSASIADVCAMCGNELSAADAYTWLQDDATYCGVCVTEGRCARADDFDYNTAGERNQRDMALLAEWYPGHCSFHLLHHYFLGRPGCPAAAAGTPSCRPGVAKPEHDAPRGFGRGALELEAAQLRWYAYPHTLPILWTCAMRGATAARLPSRGCSRSARCCLRATGYPEG